MLSLVDNGIDLNEGLDREPDKEKNLNLNIAVLLSR
jgi:hypothetical protein